MTQPAKLTIDIYSDVMCPWCIIGYAQLQKGLAMLEGEVEAEVRWLMSHEFALSAADIVWRRSKLGLRMSADQIERLDRFMADAASRAIVPAAE